MPRLVYPALALCCATLLACDRTTVFEPGEPQHVAGIWSGPITASLSTFDAPTPFDEIELVLTEDADGRITGAAAFFQRRTFATTTAERVTARAFDVEGANAFPVVAITFRSGFHLSTSELVYLRARFVGPDRLEGQLFGGGFDQNRVLLRRGEGTIIALR